MDSKVPGLLKHIGGIIRHVGAIARTLALVHGGFQRAKLSLQPRALLFKLLLEEKGAVDMVIFEMNEDDVRRIMRHPLHMVCTDASNIASKGPFAKGKPHPRHFGAYPRILGRYIREYGLLSLEEAIRKMTSFPAQRFGIPDRGLLRPGKWADITVFDPSSVIDKATFRNPHQIPEGIKIVLVNGSIAAKAGKCTGTLSGKALRKNVFT